MAPLPRKTSYAAQVAPQRCLILHMSKRKVIIPCRMDTCQCLSGAEGCCYLSVTPFLFLRDGVFI